MMTGAPSLSIPEETDSRDATLTGSRRSEGSRTLFVLVTWTKGFGAAVPDPRTRLHSVPGAESGYARARGTVARALGAAAAVSICSAPQLRTVAEALSK